MGIFTRIFGTQMEVDLARRAEKVVERTVFETFQRFASLEEMQSKLQQVKLAKDSLSEEIAREKLDMKHKLGLERMRQEQEAEMAQERLDAQREQIEDEKDLAMATARFEAKEEALKESKEMMDGFQDRQEEMIKMLLKRLPSAEIFANVGNK